jgi:hypothetical protein
MKSGFRKEEGKYGGIPEKTFFFTEVVPTYEILQKQVIFTIFRENSIFL